MPVSELIKKMNPKVPVDIANAGGKLSYRALILVGLIINKKQVFPDNWIYIHSPEFKVGRIQNFKNWSPEMSADPNKTNIGMEYFCSVGDGTWSMSDDELIELAKEELNALGISSSESIEDAVVFRQPNAYPVYDNGYQQQLVIIKDFLNQIQNLQTVGRNGLHRYNNQDHSMLTSMLAIKNLFGEKHNLWDVNTDRSYYEEISIKKEEVAG